MYNIYINFLSNMVFKEISVIPKKRQDWRL